MAADQLTSTFAALADPTRRAILARLAEGEATVNELAEPFPISLQAVSKHLKVLERAGLITRGRSAQLRPSRLRGGAAEGGRRVARAVPRLLAGKLRPPRRAPAGDRGGPAWLSPASHESRASSTRRASACGRSGPSRSASRTGSAAPSAEVPLATVSMDVRPGGAWRLTMFAEPGRREIHWKGEYREVVEPERLVFTVSDQPGRRRLRAGHRRPHRPRRRPDRDALPAARAHVGRAVRARRSRAGAASSTASPSAWPTPDGAALPGKVGQPRPELGERDLEVGRLLDLHVRDRRHAVQELHSSNPMRVPPPRGSPRT